VAGQRKIQAAPTEALFRSSTSIAVAEGLVEEAEFVCECADAGGADRIETPLEEYAEVRGHAKLFLVKPGHADEEVERVVSDEGDYEVVEKAVTPPAF